MRQDEVRLLMGRSQPSEVWTDAWGHSWRVSTTTGRLNFNYPAHAALRVHVHHRDGYRCQRCGVPAAAVPSSYSGRDPLQTAVIHRGWPLLLVLDHVIARAAGGSHHVDNLQTLCELCNLKKLREDMPLIRLRRAAGAIQ
jgi:hypothetical protein